MAPPKWASWPRLIVPSVPRRSYYVGNLEHFKYRQRDVDFCNKPLFRFSNGEIVVEKVPGVFLRQAVDQTGLDDNFKEVVDNTKVVEEVPGVIGRKGDLVRVGHRWVVARLCQQEGCPERGAQVVRGGEGRTWPGAKLPPRQVKGKEEKKDHEALTESLILQRETMRHLTAWFYPDGGWGWVVVCVAILVKLVALGPLLGSGQVD